MNKKVLLLIFTNKITMEGNFTLNIIRFFENKKQTDGIILAIEGSSKIVFSCLSLELPWKDNKNNISRIPEGIYDGELHESPTFGLCVWIKSVPQRSEILIHVANYFHDLRGCIAPGLIRKDIDGDGELDVNSSGSTMKSLLSVCPQKFKVHVKSGCVKNGSVIFS